MTTLRRMTYDDLMAQPDDGYLHELVRGEIRRMPPPKARHGRVEIALGSAIDHYLEHRAIALGWSEEGDLDSRDRLVGCPMVGEAGMRFSLPDDPDQVRGADVLYLTPEQVARHEQAIATGYIPEVPALVAEVVSPSDKQRDVDEKVADYLAGGAQLVWLLRPNTRTGVVYSPDAEPRMIRFDGVLDGEDVLPGFSVPLKRLFPTRV
jgi:Uma2 family endonuclease